MNERIGNDAIFLIACFVCIFVFLFMFYYRKKNVWRIIQTSKNEIVRWLFDNKTLFVGRAYEKRHSGQQQT